MYMNIYIYMHTYMCITICMYLYAFGNFLAVPGET